MAVFGASGLDDLCLSLEELAELPAEVEAEMLQAAGEVLQEGQRQMLEGLGLVESRALVNSISVKIVQRDGRRRVLVYPAGERSAVDAHSQRKAWGPGRGSGGGGVPAVAG